MKNLKLFLAFFTFVCFFWVTAIVIQQAVKRDVTQELGYHGEDESDIFETGYIDGTISLGPLNPEFMEFEGEPGVAGKFVKDGTGESRSLGWIPSPDMPEIHKITEVRARGKSPLSPTYDLRDPDGNGDYSDTLLSPVRDQGGCGACWAFATYGGIEGTLLDFYGYMDDFSENNVIFSSGYDWGACGGGNVDMTMGYLSRNAGPVREGEDPYSENNDAYCDDCESVRYVDSVIKLPVRAGSEDYTYIKQAVYDYGALYASMYWKDRFYSYNHKTYYYPGRSTNHAVTIVGWDDNKQIQDAPGAGAFIVKNSWGVNWGDKGYFYISYYDRSLGAAAIAAFIDTPDPLLNFDKIYYYDQLGRTSSTGFGNKTAWGANVFNAENDGNIVAVGLFTTTSNTIYEIYIYNSFNGTSFKTINGGPYSGTLTGKGYHTIVLDDEVGIEAGDNFGVVVKFETPGHNWPIPLEKPLAGYSSLAVAEKDEGFISRNGREWTDITNSYPNSSVCIKALVREDECRNDEVLVEGPGLAKNFLINNNNGSYIMAVATDGCGVPLTDVELVAQIDKKDYEINLYDDGLHGDRDASDGVYAAGVNQAEVAKASNIVISAYKNGEKYSSIEVEEKEAKGGGSGVGCFINSISI